jgi:hypothetical protein
MSATVAAAGASQAGELTQDFKVLTLSDVLNIE